MSKITETFTPGSKSLLQSHGYGDFDSLWNASLGFVDAPNIGRGGRSDVGTLRLKDASDKELLFYVKRQVNYTSKTLAHPITGVPMTFKEFNNITAFKAAGIPCLDASYQGFRYLNGERQSILITPALEGYQDLDQYKPSSINESRRMARELALVLEKMHKAGFRHGCLYPKHIFFNPDNTEMPVRLIDLEKVVRSPFKNYNKLKDLTTLQRKTPSNKSCNLYFLLCYFHQNAHNSDVRKFIQKMDKRLATRK